LDCGGLIGIGLSITHKPIFFCAGGAPEMQAQLDLVGIVVSDMASFGGQGAIIRMDSLGGNQQVVWGPASASWQKSSATPACSGLPLGQGCEDYASDWHVRFPCAGCFYLHPRKPFAGAKTHRYLRHSNFSAAADAFRKR